MKFKALFIVAGLALVSCSPKTTTVETKEPEMKFPNAKVEEGFALNAEHCTKCHKMKVTKDYTREQWDKILPNMAKKAKITPEQEASINEFINWELGK